MTVKVRGRRVVEQPINWILILVTGAIAYYGITYCTPDGERDTVRLLFGCSAVLFLPAGAVRQMSWT